MAKRLMILLILVIAVAPLTLGQTMTEKLDTTVISMIKDEGMNKSQVMEILSYLTDVYGPRLTWSPEYREAAEWTSSKLKEWGLQNVHYTNFEPSGKGWTLKKFSANVISPRAYPIIAYPKAWTPGTKGTVRGEAVVVDAQNEADLAKYKGKLKNAFVLTTEERELPAHFKAQGYRLADSSLLDLSNAGMPGAARRGGRRQMGDSAAIARFLAQAQFQAKKLEFFMNEGAAALLDGARGDGGTIFVSQASVPRAPQSLSDLFGGRVSPYAADAPKILPQVAVAGEHYNRMVRMIKKGQKVTIEMNLEVEFTKAAPGFNIIAEIPGTDLKDEIVMVGGHFDSWHAGTGATDDATGSAASLEAVRIIKKLGLKPRRTIRIALWGGEEQGLLGSRGYVKETFGERQGDQMMGGATGPLKTKPEYEKFSVYFNHDNGTGRLRGIYLQGNEAAREVFRQWFAAFDDPNAQTISLSNTGGTDHLAFDAIGLPGFQFIQDPIEYDSRTHHSNMDTYERVQADDMKQASTVMAVFLYNAAMRDQKFPREPEPVRPASGAPSGAN
jgi:hypothetical protein